MRVTPERRLSHPAVSAGTSGCSRPAAPGTRKKAGEQTRKKTRRETRKKAEEKTRKKTMVRQGVPK